MQRVVVGYMPFHSFPCLTRGMIACVPPIKWSSSKMYNWIGWACRTEILFSSPWLSLHLKVFTKLHDSVSRIQNFPASADRVWWSNTPLKHVHARQKIKGLSVTKAIKTGGIWVPLFSYSSQFRVFEWKNFQNFWQCGKNKGLWETIFGKNRGFWLMWGVKIRGQKCDSQCVPLSICKWSPIGLGFYILSLDLDRLAAIELALACLDIHGLKYMDKHSLLSPSISPFNEK